MSTYFAQRSKTFGVLTFRSLLYTFRRDIVLLLHYSRSLLGVGSSHPDPLLFTLPPPLLKPSPSSLLLPGLSAIPDSISKVDWSKRQMCRLVQRPQVLGRHTSVYKRLTQSPEVPVCRGIVVDYQFKQTQKKKVCEPTLGKHPTF